VVTLSITIGKEVHDLTVTPLQAAIINQFQTADSLTLKEISEKIGLEEGIVQRRISFWISKGSLINEEENVYRFERMKKS